MLMVGQNVLIKRPDPVQGLLGFRDHILGCSGRIVGGTVSDGWLVEFKHPISHRVVVAEFLASMLQEFDPAYDEIRYRVFVNGWVCQIWLLSRGKAIAEAIIRGVEDKDPGPPLRPFKAWPEITARMFAKDHPEILTHGRLCKITRVLV